MKIGFDVSDLCTNRADGTTRYTIELGQRLAVLDAAINWNWYGPCQNLPVPLPERTTFVPSPWPKYWTQSRLPFDLFRSKPDVLFMPIQQLPYLRPGRTKTVAVVHDLAFHLYPQQFTRKDWLLLHVFTAYVAREADHIIAVSQATADDIARFYGRTKNVHVVHHGVDHSVFREFSDPEKAAGFNVIRHEYPAIQQPYILYVGQIQPRKNLERIMAAFEQVAEQDPKVQLVLAGGHGWLQQPIIERAKASRVADRIILPGRIPQAMLPALYANAEVFVLPSLYEGFGMPVLEAMACGTPVVTSDVSSLPEAGGPAAVYIDPLNSSSLADGIMHARRERDSLSRAGIHQASLFSWDKTAEQTLAVLRS